jgi:hypothetical protein
LPFVPLPYTPKVVGVVEEFGLDPPRLDRLNAGQLIALIDRAWDGREELRTRIEHTLPALQARARENKPRSSRSPTPRRRSSPR